MMRAVRGAEIWVDALCCLAAFLDGFAMLRPPRWTGREKSSLSRSLTALLPVSAGNSLWRMAFSTGSSRSPMSGMVRDT